MSWFKVLRDGRRERLAVSSVAITEVRDADGRVIGCSVMTTFDPAVNFVDGETLEYDEAAGGNADTRAGREPVPGP